MKLRPPLGLALLALAAPGQPSAQSGGAIGIAAAGRAELTSGAASRLRQTLSQRQPQPAGYWDYSDNGASWKMGTCGAGSGQSPVDLSKATAKQGNSEALFHSYAVLEQPMTLRNDGRALTMLLPGGVGGISLGADTWDAYQVVVHTPSEHTFGGSRVALELQIYHAKAGSLVGGQAPAADATAVVAIGFVASVQANLFLDSLRQGGLPAQVGAQRMVNKQAPAKLDFGSLFSGGTFLQYTGSLTTPPCSSGVQWFVRSAPLPASVAALDDFKLAIAAVASLKQAMPGNARNLQPIGSVSVVSRTTQAVPHPGLPKGGLVDPEFSQSLGQAAQAAGQQKTLASGGQASTQDAAYQDCVKDLLLADGALKGAEAQQKVECDALAQAKQALKNAGAGVTRLQAIDRVKAQEQLCGANTKVASRLRAEAQALQKLCGKLKPR